MCLPGSEQSQLREQHTSVMSWLRESCGEPLGAATQPLSCRATFSPSLSVMVGFLCLALSLAPYTESENYRMALLEETLGIIWLPPQCHTQVHPPLDQVAQSLDQRRLRHDLSDSLQLSDRRL